MDMMTEVFNVGDKVECVRDSPDNNDSIAIGVQGVICVIVDSSPHIGVRWNEKVVGGHDCHGACSHGYGWFVTPCDIKRIDDDDEFDADTTEFDKLFESFSREASKRSFGSSARQPILQVVTHFGSNILVGRYVWYVVHLAAHRRPSL